MTEQDLPKRVRDTLERMEAAFDDVDALLFRIGQQGLQRMTRASLEELTATAQIAHNGALVTVERELETLRTHVARYLDRDPLFSMDAYVGCISRIWLVTREARRRRAAGELPDAMTDLVGQARRKYEERDAPLELQPVAAWGWVTDTDYVGVSVALWSREGGGRTFQVTSARPTMYFGSDPRRLSWQPLSDALDMTYAQLSHVAVTMTRAKVAGDRLSIHKDLAVDAAPWFGAEALAALHAPDWIALVDRIREAGLDPRGGAEDVLAYVEPARLGPLTYDEKRGVATMVLGDSDGAPMVLTVPLRPENNFLLDNLELMLADEGPDLRPDGLVGRARVSGRELRFFPYTAVYHDPVSLGRRGDVQVHEVHLSLEPLAQVTR